MIVASGIIATLHPVDWLRLGGPTGAAFGAAVVLLAVHLPEDGPLPRALGAGFPLELGRTAYALLLLQLPMFWLVQTTVPTARPVALLAVGGALAWLLALLVQDGLLRRWQGRPKAMRTAVPALVLAVAVVVAGSVQLYTTAREPIGAAHGPVVLVLGGAVASDLATALAGPGAPFTVVDGSLTGCGLLPDPASTGSTARTSALAQAPASAPGCGDWATRWGGLVTATDPAAVVVDLSTDIAPRRQGSTLPTPCDPAFRPLYRGLIAQLVRVTTEGALNRPVLLANVPDSTNDIRDVSRRCFNALVTEAVASYRAVVPLDVKDIFCPDGSCRTTTPSGRPLFDDDVHLSGAGLAELAPLLQERVSTELGPEATAARSQQTDAGCVDGTEAGVGNNGC
jgi:hypothetical protein